MFTHLQLLSAKQTRKREQTGECQAPAIQKLRNYQQVRCQYVAFYIFYYLFPSLSDLLCPRNQN